MPLKSLCVGSVSLALVLIAGCSGGGPIEMSTEPVRGTLKSEMIGGPKGEMEPIEAKNPNPNAKPPKGR